jgi:hypothetical protein
VDRIQVAATGLGVSASALLLTLGVGLIVNGHVRDEGDGFDASPNSFLARIERSACERAPTMIVERARPVVVSTGDVDRLIAGQDHPYPRDGSGASETPADLSIVQAAVLTGDHGKIVEAVARHNATGAEPVFLHDDPELARRGISVRAKWVRGNARFAVSLEAQAAEGIEPCTVLVPPGAVVKAGDDGDQDTTPLQARFIHVGPYERKQAEAEICCAQIHSNDPRHHRPAGLTMHHDPRVGLVTAAAEREHASWGAAQVAVWAVANNVTADEVASAPGSYNLYIDPARDVLEKAGIDTNKLPLYANASPLFRKDGFDLNVLGRVRGG